MADPVPQPHDPNIDRINKSQELGFIDSFVPQGDNSLAELLRHTGIGTAMGALGSKMDSRDPNSFATAAGTGIGSGAGYMLAKIMADKGMVPQDMTNPLGAIGAIGGGGLGYYLASQTPAHKKVKMQLLPGLQIKQADWDEFASNVGSTAREIYHHLPRIRGTDSLIGGGLGAGAGYLVDKMRSNQGLTKEEQAKRRNKSLLIGAGAGALGTNLVGDRFRRYLSNTIDPFGYGEKPIKPQSWKHFVDAAIKDVPTQQYTTPGPPEIWDAANGPSTALARRELLRRQMGIHTENAANDIWARNPDDSVSLNGKHKDIQGYIERLINPEDPVLKQNPVQAIGNINTDQAFNPKNFVIDDTMMGPIVGGQRISMQPYQSNPNQPPDWMARINDRFDTTLSSKEEEYLTKIPKNLLSGGLDWLKNKPDAATLDYQENTPTNKDAVKSLLSRWALDKFVGYKAPWVSQNVAFKYNPESQDYGVTPYTGTGKAYPNY